MAHDVRPRVALVSDSGAFAGAEVYMLTLVEALAPRYDFVALLSEDAPHETRRRVSAAGARVRIVPGLRRFPTPRGTLALVRAIRAVRPLLLHLNASDQGDCATGLIAGRILGARMIVTLHLVLPDRDSWREQLSRRLLGRARVVIGVSRSVTGYAISKGLPARAVLNGVSAPPFPSRTRADIGVPEHGLLVGGVGRLDVQKGWDVLCRAAALVHERRPDINFVVIGDGPERDRLLAHPQADHVHFAGYQERASEFMHLFDIAAVPSRYEGLALVAIEAMLVSTPVIATRVGGLTEVVEESSATVPVDDPDALAARIEMLAGDERERSQTGRLGRSRAEELFSVERMARETIAVYQEAGG